MSKTKIFILGASGFVGSAILKACAEDNGLYVFAAENKSPVKNYPAVNIIKTSMFNAAEAIENIRPDIVIHAARISAKSYRILGRRRAAINGRRANIKISRVIRKHNIRLLYISGSLIYGSQPAKLITEDFPPDPISYAIEYSKAEKPFSKNLKKSEIMICRPGWIFGPDSWFKVFFEDIIKSQNYVPQYGDGESFMNIIHRDDLGRLVLEYALNAPYSHIYNLLSPVGLPHKEFVEELAGCYSRVIKVISKEQLIRQYDPVTCDALTCDIHMATHFNTIIDSFEFKYTTVKDLLNS